MRPLRECSLPDTSSALERLHVVVRDPDCASQEERQMILLDTFFTVAEDRVKLRDLRLVTEVMDVIAKKAELHCKFKGSLQQFLSLLKSPIRMEKSSDQLEYRRDIVEFFMTLGDILLRTVSSSVQHEVLDIVLRIIMTKRVGDSDMLPVESCVKALELSDFAECLAEFIAISEKELFSMAVFTALQICSMSKLFCWTLLKKDVLESLLVKLTLVFRDGDVTDGLYKLLWTLLNCTDRTEDWEKIPQPSRTALRSLRYVLREQALTHSHPGKDNVLLCSTAALALKMIHLFPQADFVLSGLTEDITLSATLTESVLETHIMPYFKSKDDHLRFKKLMLACIAASPINSQSIEIYERYKLAECLVCMLRLELPRNRLSWMSSSKLSASVASDTPQRGVSTTNLDTAWFSFSLEQSLDIFKSAIPVVYAVFDCLCRRFIKAGLIKTLTNFLINYYEPEKTEIDDLFDMIIKLLFFVCSNKKCKVEIRNTLMKSGVVPILLNICIPLLSSNSPLTIRLQSTLCRILHIASALMEDDMSSEINCGNESISIVKSLYHRIIQPLPTDSVIDNRLTVAVCNFAWVTLTKTESCLMQLIDSGELYSHIDILERSDLPVQLVYLSMLVDVAEHYKSVPYLVSWRGKKGIKLLSVLCKIWRDEENRLKVPRDENGCVTDIEKPLMGKDQYKMIKNDKTVYVSVSDVLGSGRPKIFALVQLLHRHDQVTRICEEHYKIGHDELPWEDQVTLQLIQAYLPLKLGEVWWEIFLKQKEVLPIDRYLTQNLAERYLNWSRSVQRAQHAVLKQRDADLKQEEQQYYQQVRALRLTSALEALRQITAIARSADRQMLLAAHSRLRQGIEASRPATAANLELHVTFPRDVRVLVVNPTAEVVLQKEPLQS